MITHEITWFSNHWLHTWIGSIKPFSRPILAGKSNWAKSSIWHVCQRSTGVFLVPNSAWNKDKQGRLTRNARRHKAEKHLCRWGRSALSGNSNCPGCCISAFFVLPVHGSLWSQLSFALQKIMYCTSNTIIKCWWGHFLPYKYSNLIIAQTGWVTKQICLLRSQDYAENKMTKRWERSLTYPQVWKSSSRWWKEFHVDGSKKCLPSMAFQDVWSRCGRSRLWQSFGISGLSLQWNCGLASWRLTRQLSLSAKKRLSTMNQQRSELF